MSTDGRASFAAFIYEEGGADKIQTYMEDKVVGFDAGDKIRAALVHSLEFSSLGNLSDMNVFRIDGMDNSRETSSNTDAALSF